MKTPAFVAKNRSEYGQSPLDLYTPLHFGIGFIAGVVGVSPVKAALVFTVLKIAVASTEKGIGHALLRRVPGESNVNELCDLLAEISGVASGARVRAKWDPNPTIPATDPGPSLPPTLPAPAPAAAPPLPATSGIF